MSDPEVMRTVMRSPVELVDVQITGNARTKGWVIRRAARPAYFAPTTGHLLHELEGTKERLRALGIFESVEIYVDTFEDPELEFEERVSAGEPERVCLQISVVEKSPLTINAGGDISTEDAEASGNASYGLRNYLGRAESVMLRTEMGTNSSMNFSLDCHQPTLCDTDLELHGAISRSSSSNPHCSYHETQTSAAVSLDFPAMLMTAAGSLSADLSLRELAAGQFASPTIREHARLPLGHNTKASVTATLRHDDRDIPMTPTAGWAGNLSVTGALCDYVASKHFLKTSGGLQLNRTVAGLTFTTSLHAGGIFMPLARGRNVGYVRVCDRFMLGSERVRGFQSRVSKPLCEPSDKLFLTLLWALS